MGGSQNRNESIFSYCMRRVRNVCAVVIALLLSSCRSEIKESDLIAIKSDDMAVDGASWRPRCEYYRELRLSLPKAYAAYRWVSISDDGYLFIRDKTKKSGHYLSSDMKTLKYIYD
jgi:hypothetical protein